MSGDEHGALGSGITDNPLQLEILDAMVRLDYVVHSDATIAEEIGVDRGEVIDEMKRMDEDGTIILAGNTGIAGRWILPRHRNHPEAQSFFDDVEEESPSQHRHKHSGNSGRENKPDSASANEFNSRQHSISAWGEGIWTYYVTSEGEEKWINMKSGETSSRKVRPGDAPEDGDGYDDYLTGWTEPAKDPPVLLDGQLLEVKVEEQEPEVAVVLQSLGNEVIVRTERPEYFNLEKDPVHVLAVEDELGLERSELPDWAIPYRPTGRSDI